MAESSTTLNLGSGGDNIAMYADSGSKKHQEVIIQTQTSSSDPVTVNASNPLPVAAAGTVASLAANAGNPIKTAGVYNSSPVSASNGQIVEAQVDANGYLKVNIAAGAAAGGTSSTFGAAFPAVGTAVGASDGTNMQILKVDGSGNLKVNVSAGAAPAGQDNTAFTSGATQGLAIIGVADNTNGVSAITQGNQGAVKMTLSRQLRVVVDAAPSGGLTPYKLNSAATTNATSVKASAGQIGLIVVTNTNAAVRYLKLYNKASAPTVGSDTPVQVYAIPGNTAGAGAVIPIPQALAFSTGIAFALTTGAADSDTNAVALNEIVVNLGYA